MELKDKKKKKKRATNYLLVLLLLCIMIAGIIYFREELFGVFNSFLQGSVSIVNSSDLLN